ncbi:MAG: efflux RND transporter periplasmic adaptor subunit [Xanthomonadales bacterium]|nr:efflux RND transporter periplasmic adaptor subunit [Xanthomonadales bacterium]
MSRSSRIAPLRSIAALTLTALLAACGHGDETAESVRPAMVVRPVSSDLSYAVYPGEVRARHEVALGFRIGGKMTGRRVEVGDEVRKGDVLATLDPGDVRLQADAARAQVAAAEADLALANSELERHKSLLDRKLISPSLYDNRLSQQKAAAARLRQARAQLDVASNQADYATLRAPQNGVIAQRLAEVGQVVSIGAPVFVLAADGDREVVISLPESGIERYQVGQAVMITPWSKPDQRIPGTLRELAPAADASSRTYAARIALPQGVEGIELGQSARAIFALNGSHAVSVPLPAVTADAGQHFVFVVDPASSTVKRRAVTIGPFNDETVPVTEGLAEEEWVVAAGVHLLREGMKVRPVDRDNRAVALDPAA